MAIGKGNGTQAGIGNYVVSTVWSLVEDSRVYSAKIQTFKKVPMYSQLNCFAGIRYGRYEIIMPDCIFCNSWLSEGIRSG